MGCALSDHVQADSAWTVLLPGFVLVGIGLGILNPVLASASVAVVPPERSGMASGSSNTFRQVGIATGIAGLGAVFLSQIRPEYGERPGIQSAAGRAILAHGGAGLSAAFAGGDVRAAAASLPAGAVRTTLINAYQVGFTATFNHLMDIALVIALVGAVGSFFLVRQRDFVPSYEPGRTPAISVRKKTPMMRPAAHSRSRRRRRPAPVPARSAVGTIPTASASMPAPPVHSESAWPDGGRWPDGKR